MPKNYKIPCTWQMYGYVQVQADSFEDAVSKVQDDSTPLPEDASYVQGSFEVDEAGYMEETEGR